MSQQKVSIFFLTGLFLIANIFSTVDSRNDLTTIIRVVCNTRRLNANDPFIENVDDLLDIVSSAVPSEGSREYYYTNTAYGTTAYGYGSCDPSKSEDQCTECLNACSALFEPRCGLAVGAQIEMAACYIRYENYGFM